MSEDNGWETIPCAFCRGRGIDPYDQLSSRSRCEVCKGQGEVKVPVPHESCAYCRGTGSHKTFACLVCRGKGVVEALCGPTEVCAACAGRAFDPASGLECLECKGRGRIPVPAARPGSRR